MLHYKKGIMAKGIKTGGRESGTPNKLTTDMRTALQDILENEIKILPQLLEKMKPEKRAEILSRLLQYVTPKIQNIEIQTEFDRLSDEQLDIIIEKLKQSNYGQA